MLQAILAWFGKTVLEILSKIAIREIKEFNEQRQLEKERGETNEENEKKYKEAQERADKIKAATDLLNGTRGS